MTWPEAFALVGMVLVFAIFLIAAVTWFSRGDK